MKREGQEWVSVCYFTLTLYLPFPIFTKSSTLNECPSSAIHCDSKRKCIQWWDRATMKVSTPNCWFRGLTSASLVLVRSSIIQLHGTLSAKSKDVRRVVQIIKWIPVGLTKVYLFATDSSLERWKISDSKSSTTRPGRLTHPQARRHHL